MKNSFAIKLSLSNDFLLFFIRLSKPPDYILMENVKGFETSDTRSGGSRNKKKVTTMGTIILLCKIEMTTLL